MLFVYINLDEGIRMDDGVKSMKDEVGQFDDTEQGESSGLENTLEERKLLRTTLTSLIPCKSSFTGYAFSSL